MVLEATIDLLISEVGTEVPGVDFSHWVLIS